MTIDVRRLGRSLGAEVRNLDLGGPGSDDTPNELLEAWSGGLGLGVPGQHLTK